MNPLDLGAPRWRGQPGRLEVWYATFTEPATGAGFWIHVEVVAGAAGGASALGWVAAFPADEAPRVERFGPHRVDPASLVRAGAWCETPATRLDAKQWCGRVESSSWELAWRSEGPPLYTFPRWAWERELLPGAQVVLAPVALFDGAVRVGERSFALRGARGALSRIYGHGNAQRWGWLHADLGGGDVLEVVAAAPRTPLLRRLGVRPFVRLRLDGEDWPRRPLLASSAFRASPALPDWEIAGGVGSRRLHASVQLPPEQCVSLAYRDPDGGTATCTNSERATVRVTLEDAGRPARRWRIEDAAHAEVGTRP